MGRYWNTERFDGKFGVGCQGSDDPEIFGMYEEQCIHYEATEDAIPQCEETLRKQYDLLKIPAAERYWQVEDEDELEKIFDKYHDYAWELCDEGQGHWGYIDEDGEMVHEKERFDGSALALYRIFLGLAILSELKVNSFCSLEAEC